MTTVLKELKKCGVDFFENRKENWPTAICHDT